MKQPSTHYDILNVSSEASPEIIRAAYRAMALKYHPDINSKDSEALHKMKEINTAHNVLLDPQKRADYDLWLRQQEPQTNKATGAKPDQPQSPWQSVAAAAKKKIYSISKLCWGIISGIIISLSIYFSNVQPTNNYPDNPAISKISTEALQPVSPGSTSIDDIRLPEDDPVEDVVTREEKYDQNLSILRSTSVAIVQQQNPVQNIDGIKTLAEQGNIEAQDALGYMYETGHGVIQNYAEAVKWFKKAADQNNAYAQCGLGYLYANGWGVAQDYRQAAEWYRKAADQGDRDAQSNLGNGYFQGQGVPKDSAAAVKWWSKAADQGDAHAQINLYLTYTFLIGVLRDYKQEEKWKRKVIEHEIRDRKPLLNQNRDDLQTTLGSLNYNAQYYDDAEKWYRRAANRGNSTAQYDLGQLYSQGRGVAQNYKLAAEWWRKAAEQGHAEAQNNMGVAYHNGWGVPKDDKQAVEWWQKAAAQGVVSSQEMLKKDDP